MALPRCPLRVNSGHAGYLFLFANGLASSRAQLMTSCAAGLSTRFFKVSTPIGPLTIGNVIGNF